VDVVADERQVEEEAEELAGDEEQQVEEDVHHVLRQHQRVQAVALVDRVLVVSLKLVERNYVENGEKDEKCIEDESHDVAEGGEREGHLDHAKVPEILKKPSSNHTPKKLESRFVKNFFSQRNSRI